MSYISHEKGIATTLDHRIATWPRQSMRAERYGCTRRVQPTTCETSLKREFDCPGKREHGAPDLHTYQVEHNLISYKTGNKQKMRRNDTSFPLQRPGCAKLWRFSLLRTLWNSPHPSHVHMTRDSWNLSVRKLLLQACREGSAHAPAVLLSRPLQPGPVAQVMYWVEPP